MATVQALRRFLLDRLREVRASWPGRRNAARRALPSALFWLALLLLRGQVAADVGFDFGDAVNAGVLLGAAQDLFVVIAAALGAALLNGVAALPVRFGWALATVVIWVASTANLIHYRYFGMRLDWWVVRQHWRDTFVVGGSVQQLGLAWPIAASALAVIAALGLEMRRRAHPAPGPWWRPRALSLLHAALLAVLLSLLWRLPGWLGAQPSNIVSDNIVRTWMAQLTGAKLFAGAGLAWTTAAEPPSDPSAPSRVLAAFRDHHDGATAGAYGAPRPLYTRLAERAEHTQHLRARLGLPEHGPLHVIILFLESTRALEAHHPEVGPHVMPNLRDIVAHHGIDFRQAYSSAFTAGQTVRGQFSTLCSMIPNMVGAAEYIAHPTLRVRCIQEVLRDNGYRTLWMNGYRDSFHGKRTFEMLHGTDAFFDGDAYRERGIHETVGEWGVADLPFLRESVRILEEQAGEGKPLFANILTTSVHHPYGPVAQAPLDSAFVDATGSHDYYRGYAARLHYQDLAVRAFFDALFAGPLAERTLVVLMADHGVAVRPHLQLSPVQIEEMRYRIPLALVTRDMPAPAVVTLPVHQVDVAPTVAEIVGARGMVTWVGRSLLGDEGSPWIYRSEHGLSYRTRRRACYTLPRTARVQCFDASAGDPLYDALAPVAEDPTESAFFAGVIAANMQAIVFNLVQPPR